MLQPSNEDKVSYVGTSVKATPLVIATLQSKRCIEDGASTFLAMVIDKSVGSEEVLGIPLVEDFPKDFTDELLRLPSNREIEFEIELEPTTTPTHKAPYHMASAEFKELKVQLEKLLEK